MRAVSASGIHRDYEEEREPTARFRRPTNPPPAPIPIPRPRSRESESRELVTKHAVELKYLAAKLDRHDQTLGVLADEVRALSDLQIKGENVQGQILDELKAAKIQRSEAKKEALERDKLAQQARDSLTRNAIAAIAVCMTALTIVLNHCK